jgi:glycosyltransferase involved in cell wall biosynthesis
LRLPRWGAQFRFATCLCLTRNRPQWLLKAVQCFLSQTYPSRELLILADGQDVSELAEREINGIRPASALSIRYVQIEDGCTIGEKRNLGVDLAEGVVIAHWDDDDYSSDVRLSDQIHRLHESGKAVTGYHSMHFTDGKQWWKYSGASNFALGTSLCYRKEWWKDHQFPAKQVGEDEDFVREAAIADQIASVDAGETMIASIHQGNTSPRQLGRDNWKKIS